MRTQAPGGHTPILRAWWPCTHLAAISAIAPAGKRYCHGQDDTMHSADVVAFWMHLLREVSGRLVSIWDGSPIHRRHTMQEGLAHGAS